MASSVKIGVNQMSSKSRLHERMDAAVALQKAGSFAEARSILTAIERDPDVSVLGDSTTIELPRQLHSAFLKLAKAESDAIKKIGYQYHLVPPTDTLNKYARFSIAERKHITQVNKHSIPRKLHQIWIGSTQAPIGTLAWEEHAASHGYEYQLWREDSLQALGVQDNAAYRHMLSTGDLPGAVDVARYLILEQVGGLYLDCDWYPVRNDLCFHDLLPMTGLTTMAEDIPRKTGKGSTLLANSFIATPPHHPVFTRLLAALVDITRELPKAPAWWSTGPLIFTLMCRGGSVTLADADMVAGALPQATPLAEVKDWCRQKSMNDSGLLLAWRSWER